MKTSETPIMLFGTAATCADLVYATGFAAPDPVVYLQTAKTTFLVVPVLEIGRAMRTVKQHHRGRRCRVLCADDLKFRRGAKRGPTAWATTIARHAGVKRVRVPGGFPYGVAKSLMRHGIGVSIAEHVFPERAIKQPPEIKKITESQQAAVLAVRGAIAMIAAAQTDRAGHLKYEGSRLTSERMRTFIKRTLLEHNCSCPDVIIAGGVQSADPHEKGGGPLRAGEPIVMDIFPQHSDHLYWGDMTRTVVKGKAAARLRNIYHAVRAAQKAALLRIRPGVKCSTVHAAAQEEINRRGFPRVTVDGKAAGFIHGTGHGVGLCVHEAPNLGASDVRLRSGHVVTVEPGLYYPDIGGIRIEDTVLVTGNGWRYLVPCEKRLEV